MTIVKMEEEKGSRQFILCATVLRYSYVNKGCWIFNFHSQSEEEFERWRHLLKFQLPNCEKLSRLELLSKVLSWCEMDGYDRYDIGMEMNTSIREAEGKMKNNEDDFFLLNKHSTPEMAVLDVILKRMGKERSNELLNWARVLRELALDMHQHVHTYEDFPSMDEPDSGEATTDRVGLDESWKMPRLIMDLDEDGSIEPGDIDMQEDVKDGNTDVLITRKNTSEYKKLKYVLKVPH